MKVKLEGAFDRVLGGFYCVRGYASLKNLAAVSAPNPAFQRNLIETHTGEIDQFLSDQEYLFFPEVILACPLRYDFSKKGKHPSGTDPMRLIQGMEAFSSNENGLRVTFRKSKSRDGISHATLILDSDVAKEMLLSRIDGNHRISAYDLKSSVYGDYQTPFCVIFFPSDNHKPERVIFNNINFKQIPLRPEHSLKVILETFSDEELQKDRFGWPYWYTKELLSCVSSGFFTNVPFLKSSVPTLHEDCRTVLFELCKFLKDKGLLPSDASGLTAIKKALQTADAHLQDRAVSKGLLIASVFMFLNDPNRIHDFLKWVKDNTLDTINEISPQSLIDIFEKIFERRKKQIFISMPFGKDDTEDHYKHIVNAVNEINKEHSLAIVIKAVRVDKTDNPTTFEITDEILEFINDSGLLIADLSYANPNVYHEVGYAMGLAKERGLENNVILILREGLPDNASKVTFNLQGFSQLRFKQTSQLQDEIKRRIESFYGLSGKEERKSA